MRRSPDSPERTAASPAGSGRSGRSGRGKVDEVTLVGLVLETAAGLRRSLAPGLDERLGAGGQAFEVLVRLARTPGQRLRMSDLAAQTSLSPGGLTRSIDRLVEVGLAVRESCPNDRRGSFAHLTPLGAHRIADALDHHRDEVAALLEGLLSDEEARTLAELLHRLRDRVAPEAALVTGAGEDLEVKEEHTGH